MNHSAQDVLDEVNRKEFPYPFDLNDAQKVLDASPNRQKIRKCYFTWDDDLGVITINCPEVPDLTLNHPSSLKKLGDRLKDLKSTNNQPKESTAPKPRKK